ncbi:MAG: hypothetical protein IJJ74_09900 [Eubacterium sp.]|nr:hypothetical protein [Eubacterium sp.]MBR1674135.1 hypothetical protein [Eubacterium sp.]
MRKDDDIFKIDYIRRMSDLREDSDYSQTVVARDDVKDRKNKKNDNPSK